MPVQITPYRGSNPLKAMALGHQVQQGQQRLAQNERRMDMQQQQFERSYDQAERRMGLSERQLELAAERMGITVNELKQQAFNEAIGWSQNADQLINYLKTISPKMDPGFEAQIRSAPPEMFGAKLRQDTPADIKVRNQLLEDVGSDDPNKSRSARIALGLDPRAVGSAAMTLAGGQSGVTAEEVAGVEGTVALGKEAGKKTAGRLNDAITEGLLAADSTASIRRALQLIDSGVDTSRLGQAELSFMQSLGIEDPEAGELSNLMGKAVLSQLRSTFGAAFTEEEGKRLERIEAGFGRNPATNKRLLRNALQIAEASAERGIKAAEKSKDDLAVEQIKAALSLQLGVPPQPSGEPEGATLMVDAQGNKAYVYPDGRIEEVE